MASQEAGGESIDSDLEMSNIPSVVELQHLQVQLEHLEAQQTQCKWQ